MAAARLGIVGRFVPPDLVDEALAITDRDERRWRALPSRLGVYFVLALCLLRTMSGPAVLREMFTTPTLARLRALGWRPPSSPALSTARDRIGAAPLELLFRALSRWTPVARQAWSHAFGLLVCAWDGTEIALADTAANRESFPPHRGKDGAAAGVPKARVLVLLACGSRRLLGAACQEICGSLGQFISFVTFVESFCSSPSVISGQRMSRSPKMTAKWFSAPFQPRVPVPRSPLARTCPSPSM